MQQMPCTPCVRDRHEHCVLRQTKRGTYARGAVRQSIGQDSRQRRAQSFNDRAGVEDFATQAAPGSDAAAPGVARPTVSPASEFNTVDSGRLGHAHTQADNNPAGGPSAYPPRAQGVPLASEAPPAQLSPTRTPGDTPASAYQDISWTTMFDHFINNRENGNDWIDKCSITYLGESFPLAIVLDGLKDGSRGVLHHAGPPFPGVQANNNNNNVPPVEPPPTAQMQPEDLEYLRAKGVFTLPEKPHLDALISLFLDHVYPLYPIVNRDEFIQQYRNSRLSLILTHAVSFIAVTFAPQATVVTVLGFPSRPDARLHFYKKAKALFDMGYETNKITLLQATFLLSFYGGGPNTYWNFYSWLSTAVTIAEALGIHRSTTAVPNMRPQDKSLMRRLWWALVNRDSICGTLVGRPFRIDLDQADADPLTLEDFAHDAVVEGAEFLADPAAHLYAQYQIETAQLSLIMRDIIISRFYPGRQPVTTESLHAKLSRWRAHLAPSLAWDAEIPDPSNPLSASLSVQYDHHLILIYLGHIRGRGRGEQQQQVCHRDPREIAEIVDAAAHHIPTVLCALVTNGALLTVPHELYHGIFLAQAAFYERMRSPDKAVARLGRSALNSCQVVLQVISEFWDCGTFIMQLFESLSSRCLEQLQQLQQQQQQQQQPSTEGTGGPGANRAVAAAVEAPPGVGGGFAVSANDAGVFNALLGDDRWQGNPILENLFDLPPELFLPE
ncbi:fungal-specific transcription factor domain-containing protein [Aspergillus pseudodeflectus]|uniref:Fungal-specific transcription factor domain-containing protein n=1 Tax=Aspergillus pseudodeflectus TaxID=176178 RepID=A0ABR4JJ19_9EURO